MGGKYFIYCDESVTRGAFYSNFYGGLLVGSSEFEAVSDRLTGVIRGSGLRSEIKWTAITPSVSERYMRVMDALFEELNAGRVKVRIMFTQNRDVPDLTREQRASSYHLLYYQFIKWAFGLQFAPGSGAGVAVHLRLDQMPSTREQVAQFKGYVEGLNGNPEFRQAGVRFERRWIEEIDSRQHVLAQALDVVLGAMAFRLNDLHKAKPEGSRTRGQRTIHKERVYKHINALIRARSPGFNIGVSTGQPGGPRDRWEHAYRHWLFVPRRSQRDDSLTKQKKTP